MSHLKTPLSGVTSRLGGTYNDISHSVFRLCPDKLCLCVRVPDKVCVYNVMPVHMLPCAACNRVRW